VRDIKARLTKGSLWISGGRVLTNLLAVVSTIVLARLLVPADFGLVALGTTMLAILSAITNLSMGAALVQHREPTDAHYHTAWTLGVVRGLGLAAIFCLLGLPLARLYGEPRLDEVMYALSVSVFLTGLTNPRLVMMQRKLVFWQVFVLHVANHLVMAVVSIVVALLYQTYWALVAGAVAGQLVATILSYSLFPFRPHLSLRHAGELWSFSIWLTLGQAVKTMNYRFDHLLIGGFLGRPALGYYTVGSNLAIVAAKEAVLPLTQTLFPAFSAVSDSMERLRRAYQRAQATVTAIALPAGIGFTLIADPLVRLTMGAKWAPAILVIQVVGAAYAFGTLGTLVSPLAMAQGATRYLFNRSLQLFVIRMPFIIAGMYFGGLAGLLAARALVGLIGVVINMSMVRELIGLTIREQLRANLRCLAAAAAMVAVVLLVQHLLPQGTDEPILAARIAASVVAGVATYLGASWCLWWAAGRPLGPETEALELARTLLKRLRGARGSAVAE
jgi:O-antigen/teichoic acid export membrane protein